MKKGPKRLLIILLIVVLFALCIIYLINNFTVKKPVNKEAKIIDEIKELQLEGKINTKEDAINFLKNYKL